MLYALNFTSRDRGGIGQDRLGLGLVLELLNRVP